MPKLSLITISLFSFAVIGNVQAGELEDRISLLEKRVSILESLIEELSEIDKELAVRVKSNENKTERLIKALELYVKEKREKKETASYRNKTNRRKREESKFTSRGKDPFLPSRKLEKYRIAALLRFDTPERMQKIYRAVEDMRSQGLRIYGYILKKSGKKMLILTTLTDSGGIEKLHRLGYNPIRTYYKLGKEIATLEDLERLVGVEIAQGT